MSIIEMSVRKRTKREQEAYDMGFEMGKKAAVKHGAWKERHNLETGTWYYDCPFCDDGYAMRVRDKNPPNHCHNCGAKLAAASYSVDERTYKIGDRVVVEKSNIEDWIALTGRTGTIIQTDIGMGDEYEYLVHIDGYPRQSLGFWCQVRCLERDLPQEEE